MRLTFSLAALIQLLVGSPSGASAFTATRPGQSTAATASFTRLGVIKPPTPPIDPSDPYAAVLQAYQKRGAAAAAAVDIAPSLPPAPPIPDAPADAARAAADAAAASGSVADSAAAAARAAADSAARAAADFAAQRSAAASSAAAERAAQAAEAARRAVSDAASDAVAAAERAASAAADVAAPAAATATAKAASAGKAVPMAEYIRQMTTGGGGASADLGTGTDFDVLANAKEKFGLIFENIVGPQTARQVEETLSASTRKIADSDVAAKVAADLKGAAVGVTATVGGAATVAAPDGGGGGGPSVGALVQALHLQEYGAWYAAAASLVLAATQRSAGREAAQAEFEAELAEAKAKADEAAEAADAAAQGARMAKKLAAQIETSKVNENWEQAKSAKELLDGAKLRQIEVEKDMMKMELQKLTSETALLRRMLNEVLSAQAEAAAAAVIDPQSTPYFAQPDVIPEVFERMEHDPEENSRILEVIKELDEQNKKTAAPVAAAEVKLKARKTTRKKAAVRAKAAEPKTTTRRRKSAKASKKATPAKAAEEELTIVEAAVAVEEKPVATEEEAKPAVKPKATKKRAVAKKAALEADDNPWNALSDSTLKRKTIAELTNYLAEREITVTDESGKAPRKAELVSAVRSL